MSEVTFAKSFLATLDKRPIKLPADHVSDPRKYSGQSPFILPRQTHPFPRSTISSTTQQAKQTSVTAHLKPMRAGSGETITISDLTLDSTIHHVKTQYAQQSNQPLEKIKLLLNKKPAADLKTLKDLGVTGGVVELSVMVMGGGGGGGGVTPTSAMSPGVEKAEPVPTMPEPEKMEVDSGKSAPESEKAPAETGTSEVLKSEEFWADLKAFLAQRLRDDGEGERLAKVFQEACGKL